MTAIVNKDPIKIGPQIEVRSAQEIPVADVNTSLDQSLLEVALFSRKNNLS